DRAGPGQDRVGQLWLVRVVRQADRQGPAAGISSCDAVRELQAAGGTSLTGNNKLVTETGEPAARAPAEGPAARRRGALVLAIAVTVLATDIITKSIVVATLSGRRPIHLIGSFLQLTETRNPGAAFSIGGPSTTAFFTAIAVGVIVFILRTSRQIRSLGWAVT